MKINEGNFNEELTVYIYTNNNEELVKEVEKCISSFIMYGNYEKDCFKVVNKQPCDSDKYYVWDCKGFTQVFWLLFRKIYHVCKSFESEFMYKIVEREDGDL